MYDKFDYMEIEKLFRQLGIKMLELHSKRVQIKYKPIGLVRVVLYKNSLMHK